MKSQGFVASVFFLLFPALGWADARSVTTGSDGGYFTAIMDLDETVRIDRNYSSGPDPSDSVKIADSEPAMTRVGSTLYLVVRAKDNKIYCTRSTLPYTTWNSWTYVNGLTLDSPAIAATSTQMWAFVRGTDNYLYSANLTGCPSAAVWTQQVPIQAAPTAAADGTGVYVAILADDGEFRRWKLGTTAYPIARGFGSDQDMIGGGVSTHLGTEENSVGVDEGYNPVTNKAIYIPPASDLLPNAVGCTSDTPPDLALGGSNAKMCFDPDSNTGDFTVRHYMLNSGQNGDFQYNWRSCMAGFSFGMFTDNCDFLIPSVPFFFRVTGSTAINLRSRVSISASPATAGYATLIFRLKHWISQQEIELHFIPYWFGQSGCIEIDGGHDPNGRHVFAFTAACVGVPNLGPSQARMYNVDLRSYVLQRFADFFRGTHQDLDNNATNWAVTFGLALETVKFDNTELRTSVKNPALDVLF